LARAVSTFLLVFLPEALARYKGANDEMKVFRIISCKRVGAKSRIQRTDGPAILFLPARDNSMAIISCAKLR
jgi:hypothetical protein